MTPDAADFVRTNVISAADMAYADIPCSCARRFCCFPCRRGFHQACACATPRPTPTTHLISPANVRGYDVYLVPSCVVVCGCNHCDHRAAARRA